ncbi:MAG TPA: hypothetical protein VJ824_03915 [Bacillota bacterium]|nr:hypothetical protein [Bacillota bacterium]
MIESFKQMKLVSPELLKERVETIKELVQNEMEFYEIIRDRETEEHYLHFAYLHLNIAEGGIKEIFHHILPLEAADVIGILYGEQEYSFPDHWRTSYLRSGPDGGLVWFSPVEGQGDPEIGKKVQEKLASFQADGSFDEESMKKLFAEIEKMIDEDEGK